MPDRKSLFKGDPRAYAAMLALEKYNSESGIDKVHYELIKIRASQINGCAYCLNMHTRDARKLGLSEQKIYLLSAWRETQLYTKEERAILAVTESVTLIANGGLSDEVYTEVNKVLGDEYFGKVLMAAVTINAWNRIGITYQIPLD